MGVTLDFGADGSPGTALEGADAGTPFTCVPCPASASAGVHRSELFNHITHQGTTVIKSFGKRL